MEIVKLVMMETNGMGVDLPSRPYEMDLRMDSTDILNELDEITVGGTNISASSISRLASGILVPSNKPRHTNIDGGWGGKRIIFSMVISVEDRGRYREVRYISGYTDRVDYSVDSHGRVDFPMDMRLYFNSVSKISLMEVATRGEGSMIRPTIMDSNLMLRRDSIVSDPLDRNSRGRRGDVPMLLRPTDILKRSGSQQHMNMFTSKLTQSNSLNTIGTFALDVQLSKRKNNNSAEHMSSTIKKYIEARSMSEDSATMDLHDNDPNADYMTSASTLLEETSMGRDPFYHELKNISDMVTSGFIEWGELMNLDPEFKRKGDFPFITWNAQVKSSNRNKRDRGDLTRGADKYYDTSSFYDSTVESTCALMIAQSLPELLSNAVYSGVKGLVINSHPQQGEPSVHMAVAYPFIDGVPIKQGYHYFTSQINNVIIPNISKNGLMHVEAMVNAHIDTDIEIWISVDGGPEEYFAWPSWAEALTAPVVTDDERDLDVISQNVAGLVQDFAERIENSRPRLVEKASTRDIFRGGNGQDVFGAAPSPRRTPSRNYDNIDLGL